MSEHQYYEFLAIDRPLSAADMHWLRSLTTRAQITTTSLTNSYQWGGFRGDPYELLKRCFDAHVYTSNFGSRWFLLRLPIDADYEHAAKASMRSCCVLRVLIADGAPVVRGRGGPLPRAPERRRERAAASGSYPTARSVPRLRYGCRNTANIAAEGP